MQAFRAASLPLNSGYSKIMSSSDNPSLKNSITSCFLESSFLTLGFLSGIADGITDGLED